MAPDPDPRALPNAELVRRMLEGRDPSLVDEALRRMQAEEPRPEAPAWHYANGGC